MSTYTLKKLHIIPGHKCNLKCTHCATNSGPEETLNLTPSEISNIIETINSNPLEEILFTGGEPTLYLNLINRILNKISNLSNINVMVTTNGKFAKNQLAIENVMKRFLKIDQLQLSYDIYHGNTLSVENIRVLEKYCSDNDILFNISVCVSNIKQLLQIENIADVVSSKITFQKVERSGEALLNNAGFTYDSFDTNIFEKKCPNLEMITYIPSKGFTNCCSNLVFNSNTNDDANFHNKNYSKYLSSTFFNEISQQNFGELLKFHNKSQNLSKEYSSECRVCEYIYKGSQ